MGSTTISSGAFGMGQVYFVEIGLLDCSLHRSKATAVSMLSHWLYLQITASIMPQRYLRKTTVSHRWPF